MGDPMTPTGSEGSADATTTVSGSGRGGSGGGGTSSRGRSWRRGEGRSEQEEGGGRRTVFVPPSTTSFSRLVDDVRTVWSRVRAVTIREPNRALLTPLEARLSNSLAPP